MELICRWCEAPIPHGTIHVTLNHHVERSDSGVIDVLEASAVAVWCIDCAPSIEALAEAVEARKPRAVGEAS